MLISQVIFLKLKKGNPESIKGNHVHGFFFKEILASQSPELAEYLHISNNPRPFSISYVYKTGAIYWFRIASWMDEISQAVFSYFNSYDKIKLNNCVFELVRTSTEPEESVWAGRCSEEDFVKKSMNTNTFWLEHFSPTSFKSGDSHLPLPVPELIVKSVFRQIPFELHTDSDFSMLADLLQLKEYRIRSVYNRKNQGSIVSFEGKTRWQIDKRANQHEKEFILMLFNFVFYSGIGIKTSQGMGMTRIIEFSEFSGRH